MFTSNLTCIGLTPLDIHLLPVLSGDMVNVSINKNKIIVKNRAGELTAENASTLGIDLLDYRWHQLCLNADKQSTEAFLDNRKLLKIEQGTRR